ncbi:MAG: mRNA surveillance protein pelota [Promethearchaeota archaeon]
MQTKKLDKKGTIGIKVESLDDLWVCYNVILPGDFLSARTTRRIKKKGSDEESDKGERRPIFLEIQVEKIAYHSFSNRLRVTGKITTGPQDLISLGDYHTINLEVGTRFKLRKDFWPKYMLKRLQKAVEQIKRPPILIVAIETGEACVASIGEYATTIHANIRHSITRKANAKQYEQSLLKFFSDVAKTIKEHMSADIETLIIAGPGFTKDSFLKYLKNKFPELVKNVIIENVSNGGPNGVQEVIKRGVISKILEDYQIMIENRLIEEFLARLGKEKRNIAYGFEDVKKAAGYGAVETVLVLDELLREFDVEKRKRIEDFLNQIEKTGGEIVIISSLHDSGKTLHSLGNIAALLRFEI